MTAAAAAVVAPLVTVLLLLLLLLLLLVLLLLLPLRLPLPLLAKLGLAALVRLALQQKPQQQQGPIMAVTLGAASASSSAKLTQVVMSIRAPKARPNVHKEKEALEEEKQKDEKSGEERLMLNEKFVRTGETRGDFVAVTEGVEANQQIASTGVFKLRNKMPVVIDNKLAPEFSENPKPPNT